MKHTIAIMCALPQEFEAIKNVFQFDVIAQDSEHTNIWHASVNEQSVIIGVSHIGCINSSITASLLCIKYQLDALFFCGIAGGICNTLKTGDVVIPDRAFYAESISHALFSDLWGAPNPDLSLEKTEFSMDQLSLSGYGISQSTVATSDVFPAPEKSLHACLEKNAKIIDMETYPAAFVAKQFSVPFYCVRSVSNPIETHDIPDNALSLSATNAAIITKQIVFQLWEK